MLKNYLTIALRTLWRQKVYAFLNVFGLALGMACCVLMLSFVRHEWTYDRFHEDAEAIHRVNIRAVTPGGDVERKAGQPVPLAPTIAAAYPEVASAVRLRKATAVIQAEGTDSFDEAVLFTDPSFFNVFSFQVLRGNPAQALNTPDAIGLTPAMAHKYFGDDDPLGKRLRLSFGGAFEDFTVTALVDAPPTSSSITFDFLLPFERWPSYGEMATSWTSWVTETYIRLTDAQHANALAAKLPAFAAEHYAPMIQTWQILRWISEDEGAFQLTLQPLTEVHHTPGVLQSQVEASDPLYLYLILGLAVVVLLIACINFATLAVGRATRRAREVGLRKALGAARGQLMRQFWGEALLMSVLALLLGLALADSLLPFFNNMIGKTLAIPYLEGTGPLLILVSLVLVTGLVAGAYPALYLSRFHPVDTLKQNHAGRTRNRWIQALVVAQFACAIFLIVGVLVVSGQLRFMKSGDFGFDKDQVVVIPTHTQDLATSEQMLSVFQETLRGEPDVIQVTASSSVFNRDLAWNSFNIGETGHTVYINRVEPGFVETLGMRMKAGRSFSAAFAGDATASVLVNEALVEDFGLEDPVGKTLNEVSFGSIDNPVIVGVVEDYHFQSLHTKIEPIALFVGSDFPFRYLYVRFRPGDVAGSLATLETLWQRVAPDRPFSYYFLDEDFARLYQAEERGQQLVATASLLAVLIACLGLFGLAAFTAEQRTKEIGVRKVLGASVPGLIALLSKDFVALVLIAFVIAAPLAYFALHRWLDGFAYHVDISGWIFLMAGLLVLTVALATVSYQAIRAALMDPVNSLRYE